MNEVLENANVITEETEVPVPMEELTAPKRWNYDQEAGKLTMLYNDGEVVRLIKSRAIMGDNNGFFRIAVLENSMRVCLWNSNRSASLRAI